MAEDDRVELDPHPIRDRVAHLLKDGKKGEESAILDDAGINDLNKLIDGYVAAPGYELHEVVRTLWAIADWLLDEQNSPNTARRLTGVFKRDHVIERILKIEEEMMKDKEEAVQQKADQFQDFAGSEKKAAPKVGEKAPEGSLKLGDLAFPKKL